MRYIYCEGQVVLVSKYFITLFLMTQATGILLYIFICSFATMVFSETSKKKIF